MDMDRNDLVELCSGLPTDPLPPAQTRDTDVPHAPVRNPKLNDDECKLALRNALRYIPTEHHETLAPELANELQEYGHIYMYRFRPTSKNMRAYPIDMYPCKSKQAAAIMHMIMNNLDPRVAQFPHELVTYGGNGQVFSNWAQFRLVLKYLSEMTDEQTLKMYSGHPLGLFPSSRQAPRVVITNGMVIPNYSSREMYEKMFALGVTMYGQMTAGSYCYIGPQGIVHGTTITVLNAGRKYLGSGDLSGKVLVTSGLGGMSGAQAKAAVIAGCVGVIAETDAAAINKRHQQQWLMEKTDNLDELVEKIRNARNDKKAVSIGYLGNIVDVWERLAEIYQSTGELLVEMGTDQTSCHNPFGGGYTPVNLTYEQMKSMIASDPTQFKTLVEESLRRQVNAINILSDGGMYFWDYGNAFLLQARRAGAQVSDDTDTSGKKFKYPSYVQHIMGDIFSLGFGPFRWVCCSGDPADLKETDLIASQVLRRLSKEVSKDVKCQYNDNIQWVEQAAAHKLVVGSQARILYADQQGRIELALAFNEAIASCKISGPIVLSRDHHDVSGTDSPFRETSNIDDGSAFSADMAVQNFVGDSFRGATWISLHNGGGVGWGEAINGGFGLLLDGSSEAGDRAKHMLAWDVSNGVARRSWSGNSFAEATIKRTMDSDPNLKVTVPYHVTDDSLIDNCFL